MTRHFSRAALELCEGERECWDFLGAGTAAQGLKEDRGDTL